MARFASAGRILFAGAASALFASGAMAEDKAYYQGKTVRMIVGSGPGGGYDVFSRMIAPYLARRLGTTVVVENQPGAGGLTALNRLYAAPPDGYLLSLSNGTGAAFAQITGQKGVRFDLAKFSYLATVGAPPALWMSRPSRRSRAWSRRSRSSRNGAGPRPARRRASPRALRSRARR